MTNWWNPLSRTFPLNLVLERDHSIETLVLFSFVYPINFIKQNLHFFRSMNSVNLMEEFFVLLYCFVIVENTLTN